ncbi:N-acetylmuramoyl-L-alanine amidase [Sporosarcina pasteurii]|uniref:N-acetylmuramoyl-L-alanine amidase LytC n=1 Tax=Sporosarcina pasteurii TaxID=1474 RepID=A0A380CKQ6_SPOPA|nr:N-acetylmuramoyl-L-alanine amidase [Sporosarcina pasteurii]MDS9472040.1 N-acetylmuramoyl-L-alanine amidase [Sporosarcina pasteurii]QBQ06768.1 N-acetylmuramoyl-L-alanine amidase [Sporosarcina pasteurii]SUJ20948.1 N-acetylmuramoyl-L-alanine amidase LytC precursor [Sporosarcina pasteurii]
MKRWMIIGILLLGSLGIVVYSTQASDRGFFMPEEFAGVKVVIDPGHGGPDGGASEGDVIERDITLNISKELAKRLEKKGATVVMTRKKEGDALAEHTPEEKFSTLRSRKIADLKLRESIAINENPDVFISVHVNAIPDSKWRGAQVFYHEGGHPDGEFLAKAIQSSFQSNLQNTDREALAISGVYLLKKSPVPSVLVETGFISNPEEKALLVDPKYQSKVADAIMEGISEFLNAEEM